MAATERFLLLKGFSGLGNRLGALLTAIVHARLTGRTLVVDWNDSLYSPHGKDVYHLLFASPATASTAALAEDAAIAPAIWRGSARRSIPWMMRRHGLPWSRMRELLSIEAGRLDHDETIAVLFDYSFRFDRYAGSLPDEWRGLDEGQLAGALLRDHLRPAAHLAALADDFVRRHYRGPTIGIHIRQSDNMSAEMVGRKGVSVPALEAALDERLRADPGATVFVATDNRAILDHLRGRHPRVIDRPKWYPRTAGQPLHGNDLCPDKVRMAEDAVVDMLLLSRCDRLVYSSRATFGLHAAYLSGLPPERLHDVGGALAPAAPAPTWSRAAPWWEAIPRAAFRAVRKLRRALG